MDYAFSYYRLRPVNGLSYQLETRPAPPVVNGNVKVASFNVLNLFNGDGMGEGFPTSRGADTFAEYQLQQEKIVQALFEMDAHVIGLMEIENDGFGPESAIAQLVDALNAMYGADLMSYVSAGEQQGTDQISNGIIYRNDIVSPDGALQVLDSSNSIVDEEGPLFDTNRNRPSFAQQFTVLETDSTFVLNVNHLKSKGSSCGEGDDDPSTGQGNCNRTRTRAAQALHVWLEATFSGEPVMIVGDLNAYGQEDPITTLNGAGFTDLAREFNGPMAYSYTFRNEFGSLDYAMANAEALALVQDVAEWHINADEVSVFDYNEFIPPGSTPKPAEFIDESAYRSSDHDPIIVGLQFERELLFGDVNGNGKLDFRDYFTIFLLRGVTEGSSRFLETADLNDDGIIDRSDMRVWFRLYISRPRTR
jgi:predicted extracellular nuclease